MRRYLHHVITLMFIGAIVMAPFPSRAQSASEEMPDIAQPEKPSVQTNFDNVPDEYIEEAMRFNENCSADYDMRQYYDCDCLAMAYLDQRVEGKNFITKSEIELNIRNECRDSRNAAGPVYQRCIMSDAMFPPGMDPEKYCECVANTYVKFFDRDKPSLDSQNTVSYSTQAYIICRDPEQAKRFFLYNPQ